MRPTTTAKKNNNTMVVDKSTRSDFTESTEIDASFQSRTSDPEIAFCLPTVPLKHHVTIGSCDTKEIQTLRNNRNSNTESNANPRVTQYYTPMSQQRVSEIFIRERCRSLFTEECSRESFFLSDMQALFGKDKLVIEEEQDIEEEEEDVLEDLPALKTSFKQCTFGGVEIREYPIIPGDSPAGYKGVPLTIGWKPVGTVRIESLDKYEAVRQDHRRHGKELTLPSEQRLEILHSQGFCRSEIQKAIKDANVSRRQRKETMATLKHQATYEKLESLQRGAMNLLTLGKKKKAQKEYLQKYVPSYGVAPVATMPTAPPAIAA